MARRNIGLVQGIAIVGGLVVLGGAVSYLLTGRDPVEEQIDKLAATLNSKFGKGWGRVATTVLKGAIGKTMGAELIAFIEVVHRAEEFGTKHGWTGVQKRGHAAASAKARA
jgi:hypothetical protein